MTCVSGTTTASYAGNASSGVLTVTNGTHTAQIHLVGNYTSSTFTVASDNHGGATVTDPTPQAPAQRFIAAGAGMAASASGGATSTDFSPTAAKPLLATPSHA